MNQKLKHRGKSTIQLIAHSNPNTAITEQYRHIRTSIMYSSVDKELKSIMITSSEPGEGKSMTAANLAVVLAQQGKKVVLVDADLRKPSIHFTFNSSNIDGLTSVLTKKISLNGAISSTYVPDLDILTCGPIPPNPSELLDSKAMESVIKELKATFDYVVIDTPPVITVTDPQIIANKCDGIVMVVKRGKTKKDKAQKAKELLEKAESRLIGVVENGVKYTETNYYGRYN
ncbi:CpsD/CapB family tyrosine-protein kinase [Metabacillus sp. B2-18]|uniref:CpsD/CapB family tyrosine-protein kinase n=1 Tax=Bacillus sp. AFS040349 TaxID=2033502 RepID=UPI001E36EDE7|nr:MULTISPECIES: CpsD/CapB family tyrosine-protein kinase [Bacillaceae]UGB29494.1 CpsD/CapB family tyrosine-protein kinase [Metabacillus sp. B2-18]